MTCLRIFPNSVPRWRRKKSHSGTLREHNYYLVKYLNHSGGTITVICRWSALLMVVALPLTGGPQDTRVVIDRYCIGCHNSKLKSGELSLDAATAKKPTESPEVWEKVVR